MRNYCSTKGLSRKVLEIFPESFLLGQLEVKVVTIAPSKKQRLVERNQMLRIITVDHPESRTLDDVDPSCSVIPGACCPKKKLCETLLATFLINYKNSLYLVRVTPG